MPRPDQEVRLAFPKSQDAGKIDQTYLPIPKRGSHGGGNLAKPLAAAWARLLEYSKAQVLVSSARPFGAARLRAQQKFRDGDNYDSR